MNSVSIIIPVFCDSTRAIEAVRAIEAQALDKETTLEIIVVDDGSEDGTAQSLAALDNACVRVLALPNNVGRSAARNAGANEARGEFIVFMDCDCLPTGSDFLANHLLALAEAVASTGHVIGVGNRFWSRYQAEASLRRKKQHEKGMSYSGSSQNIAVHADAFRRVGGFDATYRQYGFEDRDLLLRLARLGPIVWTESAEVCHRDSLQMREVARKMAEAGEHSSTRFAAMHPRAYDALGYGRLDARRNSLLRLTGRVADKMLPAIAALVDGWIALPVPYASKALAARVTAALAYCCGTARADDAATSQKP